MKSKQKIHDPTRARPRDDLDRIEFGALTCDEIAKAVRLLAALGYRDASIAALIEWDRMDVRRVLSVHQVSEGGSS